MADIIIKAISIQEKEVWITSEFNSSGTPVDASWEWDELSEILASNGRTAVLDRIGEELWNKEIFLVPGNPVCDLFLKALGIFPAELSYLNFDSKTAGIALSEMVQALERNPETDLSHFRTYVASLMNDPEHILKSVARSGMNCLNFASKELQSDREFALKVVKAGRGEPTFDYPVYFKDDKEFALQALEMNGCMYRELSERLKGDRDVIMAAFRQTPERKHHEFLSDQIPLSALYGPTAQDVANKKLDKEFLFKLIEACPSIRIPEKSVLLKDIDVAIKWAEVGTFFPHRALDVPVWLLKNQRFQDALILRFRNTDEYKYLETYYDIKRVPLKAESLDKKIHSASSRSANEPKSDFQTHKSIPER